MNSRGDTHVDWILSFGFFIVVVVLIFLFFRPFEAPAADTSFLLETVITNFMHDFTWELHSTPLFVRRCLQDLGINYTILIGRQHTDITLAKYRAVLSTCSPASLPVQPNCNNPNFNYQIVCSKKLGEETIFVPNPQFVILENQRGVFTFVHANLTSLSPEKPILNVTCVSDDPPNANFTKNCVYTFGDTDSFRGVNTQRLAVIQGSAYRSYNDTHPYNSSVIKSSWNYPSPHHFFINSSDLNLNYKTAELPQSSDVVVREIRLFTIDNNSTKKPVSIFFGVW